MSETILVTQVEYGKGEQVFRTAADFRIEPAPPEEQALADAVLAAKARAVIVGVHPYSGPLYTALATIAAGRGAIIARFGVGHDSVDKRLAAEHGITVTNTPGVLDQSVAEHALWLMGNLARRITLCQENLRAGRFQGPSGIELGAKTLGVLGCGAIGRRVARIAHFGLGMRVIAADQRPLESLAAELGLDRSTHDCDLVLRESDVVSIHLPATTATRHFIDRRRLALMRPSAFLVNTARGILIDEAALYDALSSGSIAGAALDVYETEPYAPVQPDKDLRRLENTVLTPHIGSNTLEANRRMAEASLACVTDFLAGRRERLTPV